MAVGIAAGIAGAGLLGDIFSSMGQKDTNTQNMAIAQKQMDFQAQQTKQVEDWEMQSSNTAMQRRVEDLKAAGLNPLLAVGQGGASTPGVSPPSGASIPVQNPAASFGNAGQIAASAVQASETASQIQQNQSDSDLKSAQAELARVQAAKTAGVDTSAGYQGISESQTRQQLMGAQIDKAHADVMLDNSQIRVADARVNEIAANIKNLASSTNLNDATTALRNLDAQLQDLNVNQFAHLSPEIIRTAIANANSATLNAGMLAKAYQTYQGNFGTAASYMDRIANWLHIGANISQSSSASQVSYGR